MCDVPLHELSACLADLAGSALCARASDSSAKTMEYEPDAMEKGEDTYDILALKRHDDAQLFFSRAYPLLGMRQSLCSGVKPSIGRIT